MLTSSLTFGQIVKFQKKNTYPRGTADLPGAMIPEPGKSIGKATCSLISSALDFVLMRNN